MEDGNRFVPHRITTIPNERATRSQWRGFAWRRFSTFLRAGASVKTNFPDNRLRLDDPRTAGWRYFRPRFSFQARTISQITMPAVAMVQPGAR